MLKPAHFEEGEISGPGPIQVEQFLELKHQAPKDGVRIEKKEIDCLAGSKGPQF